jgi:HK97 family phage major capsid protein
MMEVKKEELGNLTYELRKALEQKDASDVVVQGKIANLEKELDKYEAKSAELAANLAAEAKAKEELKEQFDAIEKKLARLPKGTAAYAEKSVEVKELEDYVRFGDKKVEIKYLRTDSDNDGGYLVPEEFAQEIIKKITEISPVRQVARVRTTSRESIQIPKRNDLVQGYWVGEGIEMTEGQSNYGTVKIAVEKLAAYTIITAEMLSDAAFNMESEINQDIVERFAQIEGYAYLNGDGVAKPFGILSNTDIQDVNSGIANSFDADALINVTGELKTGYNPSWMLNRRTLAFVRRLKDTMGQYIWQPGLAAGQPNTILGHPYFSAIDMPDIAAGSVPVLFGDFMRGYTILDHTDMSLIRDPYSLSREGKIQFVAHRRTGGQVVLPEAIKKLKVAA